MLVCDLCACPSLRSGPFLICRTCMDQISLDRAALAHERDRAKRVVRVFWRVRWDNFEAPVWMTYSLRNQALAVGKRHKSDGGKVYRVTVRRVKR